MRAVLDTGRPVRQAALALPLLLVQEHQAEPASRAGAKLPLFQNLLPLYQNLCPPSHCCLARCRGIPEPLPILHFNPLPLFLQQAVLLRIRNLALSHSQLLPVHLNRSRSLIPFLLDLPLKLGDSQPLVFRRVATRGRLRSRVDVRGRLQSIRIAMLAAVAGVALGFRASFTARGRIRSRVDVRGRVRSNN